MYVPLYPIYFSYTQQQEAYIANQNQANDSRNNIFMDSVFGHFSYLDTLST